MGRGPGEFALIASLKVGPGDSLHVFDYGLRRLSVLSPSLAYVRASSIPGPFADVVLTAGGGLLIAGPVASPSQAGFSVHRYGPGGEHVRSFAELQTPFTPQSQVFYYRPIARATEEIVWLGSLNRYRLELWNTQGKPVRSYQRIVSWFPEWTDPSAVDQAIAPPRVSALSQDSQGILWVVIGVPDANASRTPTRPESLSQHYRPDERYDSVIEAFDPRAGRVVASLREAGAPLRFIGGDLAYRFREKEDGSTYIEVVRVELLGYR
jgi:hypothetical protein